MYRTVERGEAVFSDKYDLTKHPSYYLTGDANPKNLFHVESYLKRQRRGLVLHPEDVFSVEGEI